jgi:eukaryotic-like serine/threonine-protein kinase
MSIHPGPLGKYDLQECLGRGGMAEVWKAFDRRLQRYVAIKFLHTSLKSDPTFIARFEREAQAVASLRHPNIVRIYDFEVSLPGIEDSQAYMVMDYIEGTTLVEYMNATSHQKKFPSAGELVSLLFSMSEAIDYAHQRGILHRDIKPANVLLDKHNTARNPMGEPILSDFGIVKLLGTDDGTLTIAPLGTPLYVSPEQAISQSVSTASDIYSLGVILYEMCTGAPPFQGNTPFAVMQQHMMMPPPPPERSNSAISPALSAVIIRGLAKDPDARFPNAMALTAALAEALGVPLPERQRVALSSPDIRELPASSNSLSEEPTRLLADQMPAKGMHPTSYGPMTPWPDSPMSPKETPTASTYISEHSPVAYPLSPIPAGPTVPVRPVVREHKRRGLFIGLVICLSLILIGSVLGTILYLNRPVATTAMIVGQAFFTSSSKGRGEDNLGLSDMFQVNLTNIPLPDAGKRYYAWLLPDMNQSEADLRALGPLTVNGSVATLPSPYVDPQHNNLLVQFSRFLVTEEDANVTPTGPAPDTKLWRYYATLPQTAPSNNCQNTINQLSALCHLRHLLSGDPEIAQVNLKGGLNFWFLNNVEDVQGWAGESASQTNPVDIRHKIVNILYALDGRGCINQDIQQRGHPGLDNKPDDNRLASIAAIPLVNCPSTPNITGFAEHIHNHLSALIHAPDVQNDQATRATQIATELNTINDWLTKLQNDVRKLVAMDNNELLQSQGQSLRDEVKGLANNIVGGGTNENTNQPQKGVKSISEDMQKLANMDVIPYTRQ